jgi:hypothetical protein
MIKDLLDTPTLIPVEVKDILQKYEHGDFDYNTCRNLQNELEDIGYTFDWGLDAEPFYLRPIRYNFIAFCRESNQTYSFTYIIKDTIQLKTSFEEFEKTVPFMKWHYEIHSNNNYGKVFIDVDDLELTIP